MRAPPPRHRPRPRLALAPLPRRAPPPGATAASCHRAPPHRVARTATTNTAALLAHTHREPRAAPPRHHRHRAAAPPRRGERRPPGMPRRSRRRPSCARCSSQQLQWVPDGRDGINGRGHAPGSRGYCLLQTRPSVADPARTRAPCVMLARGPLPATASGRGAWENTRRPPARAVTHARRRRTARVGQLGRYGLCTASRTHGGGEPCG